jgi:PleD family two-component response regulator
LILGVTGDAHPECIQEFMDKGADDVMIKPITYDHFQACLRDQLRVRKLQALKLPQQEREKPRKGSAFSIFTRRRSVVDEMIGVGKTDTRQLPSGQNA